MSIAEKQEILSANNATIAENEQRVYDSGYDKAVYDWWKAFTANGTRRTYEFAFYNATWEYIRPPFKLIPTRDAGTSSMFNTAPNLKKVESKYIDFSQKAKGTSNSNSYYWIFNYCTQLREIEDIGFQPDNYGYLSTFRYCERLHTIAVIRVAQQDRFQDTFVNCLALENLTIEGTIGQNGFNVQWSTKLTHDSLMSIVNALADYSTDTSGTTWTVTLGSANIAKLTEEEQAIATSKGWILA